MRAASAGPRFRRRLRGGRIREQRQLVLCVTRDWTKRRRGIQGARPYFNHVTAQPDPPPDAPLWGLGPIPMCRPERRRSPESVGDVSASLAPHDYASGAVSLSPRRLRHHAYHCWMGGLMSDDTKETAVWRSKRQRGTEVRSPGAKSAREPGRPSFRESPPSRAPPSVTGKAAFF